VRENGGRMGEERVRENGGGEAGKLPLYCIGGGQASCHGQPCGLARRDRSTASRGVSLPHTHLYSREAACLPLYGRRRLHDERDPPPLAR